GRSGAEEDRQISLEDLLVSVEERRFVQHSRRLGREIVPRLTTAHNYSMPGANLAIYRFLCMLQEPEGLPPIGLDWGPLASAPFLPRVSCGRIVLHRARWLLKQQDLRRLSEPDEAGFAAWQSLRVDLRLPRFVALADSDNELPIDLDNVLAVEAATDVMRQRSSATLVEMFPGPDELCAGGSAGAFVHELVVPIVRRSPEPETHAIRSPRHPAPAIVGVPARGEALPA